MPFPLPLLRRLGSRLMDDPRWTRRAVAVTAALGIVGVLASAALSIGQDHRREVTAVLTDSERAAAKLASRTEEVLQRVNQTSLLIKFLAERQRLPRLEELAAAGALTADAVQFAYVTDERGFVRDSTSEDVALNVADEEFFKRHRRDSEVDLLVGPPQRDAISGRVGVPVTRRLMRHGEFAGVVALFIEPSTLSLSFGRQERHGTAVGVLGADGIYRSRTLDGRATHGERVDLKLVLARAAEVKRSLQPVVSPIDGVARFVTAVPVPRYPLHVIVAHDSHQALVDYRRARDRTLLSAVAAVLGMAVGGWILADLLGRLTASRQRLRHSEASLRATLEGSVDAVAILQSVHDATGRLVDMRVLDCNRVAAQMLGWPPGELVGRRLSQLIPGLVAGDLMRDFERVARTRQPLQAERACTEGRHAGLWLHHQFIPLPDGVALVTRDITQQKAGEQRLADEVRQDPLTKLLNRRGFEEALQRFEAASAAGGLPFALLYLDLDGFKRVNDERGHDAGDAVLQGVAKRLRGALRDSDLVARLGGDEFAVLAPKATGEGLYLLCERILQRLSAPHALAGGPCSATPSIGCVLALPGEDGAALRQRADQVMYRAKRGGKARFIIDEGLGVERHSAPLPLMAPRAG
ncbi:diguanylate cyclase domain-containing protein [Aquabacterium sp. J223]|uniref:sensor domain-containing diguanylate cyclase n=1 Tax=Aquabacterium sp. J223 TaxID=2898431 RepID=UPI0021ADFFB1|nr:diguanylate cyclase [Aquabacterium sp. J223]UUX95749.1 diguanylate cyclase [Aquabacterium sp. J223]